MVVLPVLERAFSDSVVNLGRLGRGGDCCLVNEACCLALSAEGTYSFVVAVASIYGSVTCRCGSQHFGIMGGDYCTHGIHTTVYYLHRGPVELLMVP